MKRVFLFVILVIVLALTAGTAYAKDTTKPIIKNVDAEKEQSGLGDVYIYFESSEKVKVTVKVYKGSKLVKTFLDKSIKNEDRLYWNWYWKGKKADGNYTVKIYAQDYAGNKAVTKKVSIKVDSVSPKLTGITVTDDPFIPDGQNKKEVQFTLKDEAYVYIQVYEYNNNEKTFAYANLGKMKPGTYGYDWDGKENHVFTAPTGTYQFQVIARDNAFNKSAVLSKSFTLKNELPPEFYDTGFEYGFIPDGTEQDFWYYCISRKANMNISLFKKEDSQNVLVKKLYEGEAVLDDYNIVTWDGKDSEGNLVTSGTLYVIVTAKDESGKEATLTSPDYNLQ